MTSDVYVILYLLMYGYQCKYYVQFATGDLLFLHRSLRSHKAFFMYLFVLNCFLCFCLVVILMQQFLLIQRLISPVGDK